MPPLKHPPILFLRMGWMARYQGISPHDKIRGGGSFVASNGYGLEIFNFLPFGDHMFGYMHAPAGDAGAISLERLGATRKQSQLDGVLVVWVATPPDKGTYIVGWYKNASVYRKLQPCPDKSVRTIDGLEVGYWVSCEQKDAALLAPLERVFPIPHVGKGAFGQAQLWYADSPDVNPNLRSQVLAYVEDRTLPSYLRRKSVPRQRDPELRKLIEEAAVRETVSYFQRLGYDVESCERDNVGWDLNARCGDRILQIEVKGLSGDALNVELTPNEFSAMKARHSSYQLCVVTNALRNPCLAVFSCCPKSEIWMDATERTLQIETFTGARCHAN